MKFNPVKRFPKPQNAAERPSLFAPPPPRRFGQNYDFNKKRKEAKRTLKNKTFSTTTKKKTDTNKTRWCFTFHVLLDGGSYVFLLFHFSLSLLET